MTDIVEIPAEIVKAVKDWLADKRQLETVKANEMEKRKNVASLCFPTPIKGTQRYGVGEGYFVKLVYKLNYKLGDVNLINPDTGGKIRIDDQVFALQEKIEALGEVATLVGDRLIKWSPELSVSEYDKLDLNDPIQLQIRNMIDEMLTISEASPTLEFEEPKVK